MKKDKISIELIMQASLIIGIIVYQFLVIVFTFDNETSVRPVRHNPHYQNKIATSNLNNSIQEIGVERNVEAISSEQTEMFTMSDSNNFVQLQDTYLESICRPGINPEKKQFQN